MSGTFIDFALADGTLRAWVATPPAGSGPGLVLLPEIFGIDDFMRDMAARYAEEGYLCCVPDLFWRMTPEPSRGPEQVDEALALRARFDVAQGAADVAAVIAALRAHPAQLGKVGVLGYCMGGQLACLAGARGDVDCAVAYYPTAMDACLDDLAAVSCPLIVHLGTDDAKIPAALRESIVAATVGRETARIFSYPGVGHAFANHRRATYDKPAALMAYSRSLALLRTAMGPIYDLSTLWDKHTEYEFATRDVDQTMATMVDEPYVNHIPTMTGGVGHAHLKRFYKYHFVNSNPPDTRLIPISRTVGADRLVDEMIFCFTHTCEIPWMLPGIAPTGHYVEIPLVAIVNFRGAKLYHEHIYWDQASVLVQIGKLDPTTLPVAGIATARKLVDETLPSNELMAAWAASADKPL